MHLGAVLQQWWAAEEWPYKNSRQAAIGYIEKFIKTKKVSSLEAKVTTGWQTRLVMNQKWYHQLQWTLLIANPVKMQL